VRFRHRVAAATVALLLLPAAGCEAAKPIPRPEAALASAGDRHWQPRPGLRWQIQLTGAFVDAVTANVYDLDPYATSEDRVTDLHAQGRETMCHLTLGASDMSLPDAHRMPRSALGAEAGAGSRSIDIRQWDRIEPIIAARLTLCQSKGFDAVDADTLSAYPGIGTADQLTYARRVVDLAHQIGLKAGVRTNGALAEAVAGFADFAIATGCFAHADCDDYAPFIKADKAVFDLETVAAGDVCPLARAYGIAVTKSSRTMNGRTESCG
jgi:hypothetical protein